MSAEAAAPTLPPAVQAFDRLAPDFDAAFGDWKSVAAQRRAVRAALLAAFPPGARLLELGGGTGEDALFLAGRGFRVHVTDGAPAMVAATRAKAGAAGLAESVTAEGVTLEELPAWADARTARGAPAFQGAFSNFAALNCVADRAPVARGLARLLAPGARALLVVFGPASVGETAVLLARGRFRAAFRRYARRPAPARVAGATFAVTYPSPRALAGAFRPWFRLRATRGVGLFVPPSSAEPWISRHPRLLARAEALDRALAGPLALLADHVLLDFERTDAA